MAVMFAPPETRGMVFNVGNPDERTIKEFADIIGDLCGSTRHSIPARPAGRPGPPLPRHHPHSRRRSAGTHRGPGRRLARTIEWFRAQVWHRLS